MAAKTIDLTRGYYDRLAGIGGNPIVFKAKIVCLASSLRHTVAEVLARLDELHRSPTDAAAMNAVVP